MSKPITLYGHARGPNPWKVAIVLEELGLPYTIKMMEMTDLKKEPYESININGRVPAIEDPNTGMTLWESGAIIQYLVATYDKANKLSYGSSPDKFLVDQWLFFQVSGQGPYFGQLAWFLNFHPEKVQSAVDRYHNEVLRVLGVLDRHLAKQPAGVLVGDKVTYADLSFVNWNMLTALLGLDAAGFDKYPHFKKWNEMLLARPAVVKVREEMAKAAGGS